jgi:hypothetical protein
MLCLLGGHRWVELVEPNSDSDSDGCCLRRIRCERCGKVKSETTATPHSFVSVTPEDVHYRCDQAEYDSRLPLNSADREKTKGRRHIVYATGALRCGNCGFTKRTWEWLYEDKELRYGPLTYCYDQPRVCPSCRKEFPRLSKVEHRLVTAGTYRNLRNGCDVRLRCELCGHEHYGLEEPHDFGDWMRVSDCESRRNCSRCDTEDVDDRHDWIETRRPGGRSLDYDGDCINYWTVDIKCSVCGQEKTEERSDF